MTYVSYEYVSLIVYKADSFKNEKTCLYDFYLYIHITIVIGYKTGLSEKCVIEYLITKQRFISACISIYKLQLQ